MRESAAATLSQWGSGQVSDDRLLADYREFAADPETTLRETSVGQHLTVSSFVFTEALDRVLLCLHRKGKFWLQLGGHIEAEDGSLLEAAEREAREESGLAGLRALARTPVDLDRHALAAGFGLCQVHWDVGFAFVAEATAALEVSDESEDVQWWPVAELPQGSVAGLGARIQRIVSALRAPAA